MGAALSGTTTITIPVGASSATFSGMSFASTASGVQLLIVSASGVALQSSALSASFSVLGSRPLPTEGFTNPTPQRLPYMQNWGTNVNSWIDGGSDPASNYLLPIGMVGLRGAGSPGLPIPARTQEDAVYADFPSNGFVGGGAVIAPVTIASSNVAMELFRSNTRANGLLLALNTNGFENIELKYTLALSTSVSGSYFGLVALYRVGTSGAFTVVSGSLFESSASGVSLNTPISYVFTLPGAAAGVANLQIIWVYWNGSASAGVWIDDISVRGSQTDYLTISTPTNPYVGDDIAVTITSYDKTGALKNVSANTVVTITGNAAMTNTTATIPAGSSSVVLPNLKFDAAKFNASLQASVVSGDAFGAGNSGSFNVLGVPSSFKVLEVQPLANVQVHKPISLKLMLVDGAGNPTLPKADVSASASVSVGTGALSGTTTGIFLANTDSIIVIKGLIYNKAETRVKLAIAATGFTTAISDTFTVYPDRLAGLTILYSEDFEKTVRKASGNPDLPAGMKMYNLDGQTANSSTYPRYGKEAWVINRIPQEGYAGRGPDTKAGLTYWYNINSSAPDSNYIAYSASWFDDITVGANR